MSRPATPAPVQRTALGERVRLIYSDVECYAVAAEVEQLQAALVACARALEAVRREAYGGWVCIDDAEPCSRCAADAALALPAVRAALGRS